MRAAAGFASDTAPLLGGAALVLSFVMLHQRRVRSCLAACALQGLAVALVAAWQGWVRTEPQPILAAVATVAANGILLPLALARIAERRGLPGTVEPALGAFASMLLGCFLVALAVFAVRPVSLGGSVVSGAAMPTHEDLALALSVVLLGLVTMIARRDPLLQIVGVLALGNGLILAAVGVPSMSMTVGLTAAVLAWGVLAVLGTVFRIRSQR